MMIAPRIDHCDIINKIVDKLSQTNCPSSKVHTTLNFTKIEE